MWLHKVDQSVKGIIYANPIPILEEGRLLVSGRSSARDKIVQSRLKKVLTKYYRKYDNAF